MLLKKFFYLNIIRNKLNLNLIWLNNLFNLKILLIFKYKYNKQINYLKKIIKNFVYQNGFKYLYLRIWILFGIRNNLISNLLIN